MLEKFQKGLFLILLIGSWMLPGSLYASGIPKATGVFGIVRHTDLIEGLEYVRQANSQNKVLNAEEVDALRKIFFSKVWKKTIDDPQSLKQVERIVREMVLSSSNLEHDFKNFQKVGLSEVVNLHYDRVMTKMPPSKLGEKPKYSDLFLLAREPLKSFEVGMGTGRTAAELNIKILFHHVSDNTDTLRSLIRSGDGKLNALVSMPMDSKNRAQSVGQAAMIGQGFYTAPFSYESLPDTMGVALQVHPMAKDGTDFSLAKIDHNTYYVRVMNKNAVRIAKINYGRAACSKVF